MFEDALDYPRSGEEAAKTIVIGGVLGLLGFLVVPAFIVLGYEISVLRAVLDGETEPPAFEDWGDLLVDGVKAFVVSFVYLLVPALLVSITAGSVVVGVLVGETRPGAALALGGLALVGALLAGVLALALWYAVPAALANLARTGRLADGFALEDLRPVLTSGSYATAWLEALVVLVGGGLVVSLVNLVPVVGFLLGPFVAFYAGVAATYLYGRGYAGATPAEPGPEPSAGQPAA